MVAKLVAESELNSFFSKFKGLCNAEFEASLQFNSKNGQATVSLEVKLGSLLKSSENSSDLTKQKCKRSPS